MRMMMKVSFPVEKANKALKEGMLQKTVMGFAETAKPEAVYFTTEYGKRTGLLFFEMNDSTMMPSLAEPFFQNLDAEVTWSPVMNLVDLKAGLEKSGKII
ncbi:MAG: hypothetical protein A2X86_08415 [Bdellovibrionales bacterium GWA2_49_15]|nr:MAG: hypothetical protein A2X86_08415 [Bdellovibrionales bacterium GWA2_49_15]HAZ11215.1 hypothetical protein [Bdellovibrionales bacterium]